MLELRPSTCFPPLIIAVIATIACVDASIAVIALWQLTRIHSRTTQLGWNREKVFHLMISLSNFGYLVYFLLTIIATCNGWSYWSSFVGFVFMAFPEILLLAAFLLLLSYWIDLCHQVNDEDDGRLSSRKALLEKKSKQVSSDIDVSQRCLPIPPLRVDSRQKIVVSVTVVAFVSMIACAVLIWIGTGHNPIDSQTVARVYVDAFAVGILLLGITLACYGFRIYLKMSKVRSEGASSEMWKVTGLATVSLVCFTISALVTILTNIPVLYLGHQDGHTSAVRTALFLTVYYFIGSSTPSGFVLWVMRDLPPARAANRNEESIIVTFVSDRPTGIHNPQYWTNVASSQSQNSNASPI